MLRCLRPLSLGVSVLLLSRYGAWAQTDDLACNTTLYDSWYTAAYDGNLASSPTFWVFTSATLTNGYAMEKAASQCWTVLNQLKVDRAGRHGPVEDWWIYDAM